MRTVKLVMAYDGTDFCGWQKQEQNPPRRTVQAVIETALAQMHRHPVAVTGCGRTDSGVHAAAQVAGFHTDIESIPTDRFVPALNGLLPRDVRILEAADAEADFHARFDAKSRTYRYFFIAGRTALPHESRYALQLWRRPRIDLLNAYCRLLLGERDCTIFAGAGDWQDNALLTEAADAARPVRTIMTSRGHGNLPLEGGFFTLDNPLLQVSAVKMAEDDSGWIVRLFNPSETAQTAVLSFRRPLAAVERCRMDETPIASLACERESVSPAIAPKKIVTLRVRFD